MAITFLAAPVATVNRIRYAGLIEAGGGGGAAQGDLTRAAILAALPNGPLKTALAAIPLDGAGGWNNLFVNLDFEISMYFVRGLGAVQTVPVTIDTLVDTGVPLFRFYVPDGVATSILVFQLAFNHSIIR